MRRDLAKYLEDIAPRLHLGSTREREILQEMYCHLEDRVDDLVSRGCSRQEAVAIATARFGRPDAVAGQMYQVYSMQPWGDAALAATPYIVVSLLFALHLWESFVWLAVFFGLSIGMTLLGWWRGKPQWMYPWAGYSLVLPVVSAVIAAGAAGQAGWMAIHGQGLELPIWAYAGLAIYVPMGLGLAVSVMRRVVATDWIYASLMMLPFPVLARWLLSLQWEGSALVYQKPVLGHGADGAIALLFLCLAILPVLFMRLKKRRLRIAALFLAAPPSFIVASSIVPGSWTIPWVVACTVLSLGLLLVPAVWDVIRGRGYRSIRG